MALTQSDFEHLLQLRTGLRRFLRWSDHQSKAVGVTPAQSQLLLAIRGHPETAGPTIGEVAEYLVLRHHSAVGLIDRAELAGLVKRNPDPSNSAAVRLTLTPAGLQKLERLGEIHREELAHLAPTMHTLWQALERPHHAPPHPAGRRPASEGAAAR
jgi:DNA-binding MarR family transcriptional regulator